MYRMTYLQNISTCNLLKSFMQQILINLELPYFILLKLRQKLFVLILLLLHG